MPKTTPFEIKSVSQTQIDGGNRVETIEKKRDEKSLKKLGYEGLIFFSFLSILLREEFHKRGIVTASC